MLADAATARLLREYCFFSHLTEVRVKYTACSCRTKWGDVWRGGGGGKEFKTIPKSAAL